MITTTWSEDYGILLHLLLKMSYINFIWDSGKKWSHTDIFLLFTVPFVEVNHYYMICDCEYVCP